MPHQEYKSPPARRSSLRPRSRASSQSSRHSSERRRGSWGRSKPRYERWDLLSEGREECWEGSRYTNEAFRELRERRRPSRQRSRVLRHSSRELREGSLVWRERRRTLRGPSFVRRQPCRALREPSRVRRQRWRVGREPCGMRHRCSRHWRGQEAPSPGDATRWWGGAAGRPERCRSRSAGTSFGRMREIRKSGLMSSGGNGATAETEAPASRRKPPATATPSTYKPPRPPSTLPSFGHLVRQHLVRVRQ